MAMGTNVVLVTLAIISTIITIAGATPIPTAQEWLAQPDRSMTRDAQKYRLEAKKARQQEALATAKLNTDKQYEHLEDVAVKEANKGRLNSAVNAATFKIYDAHKLAHPLSERPDLLQAGNMQQRVMKTTTQHNKDTKMSSEFAKQEAQAKAEEAKAEHKAEEDINYEEDAKKALKDVDAGHPNKAIATVNDDKEFHHETHHMSLQSTSLQSQNNASGRTAGNAFVAACICTVAAFLWQ
jgi:uncharacterized membrane protein YhiD involved in acid resistance